MNNLLTELDKIKQRAKAGKFKKILLLGFKYIYVLTLRYVIYPFTKKSVIKKTKTFFHFPIEIVLPASSDIYLFGGKVHNSEIRLAKFIINNLKPGNTFIDIGAHLGYFTLLASQVVMEEGRVFSYEASPNIFEILKKNTSANKNIFIFNNAVSDKSGQTSFYEFPVLYSEYNTLHPEQFSKEHWFKKYPPEKRDIESITLDSIITDNSMKPDLIKIDAEGAEYKIIEGGINYLREFSPIIIMEYLIPERNNNEHKKAVQLLKSINYKSCIIGNEGIIFECKDIEFYLTKSELESDNIVLLK